MTHIEFAYPGGIIISSLGAQSINPLITVLASVAGAIIGALVTYYLNYAKTKAMMKWKPKYDVYNAILELDKGRPGDCNEKDQEIRLAKRLKFLSEKDEFKELADKIIENRFDNLAAKQTFIDEEFIPAIEKDLDDTMNFLKFRDKKK